MTLHPAQHHSLLTTRPWTGATAMARDHGSIALNARYARPKGVPLPTVYLRTVPYIRPFSIPKKENSTQNLELKTHNSVKPVYGTYLA